MLVRGVVYKGIKIDNLISKYPLLTRILIPVEEYKFSDIAENKAFYDEIVNEIGGIKNV
ncbi:MULTISPECIES: hypothetical protein [unclassified Fusobacterium]|nr:MULTISPECIES: hypothetical protein [unclassified Fusobacterium]